MAGISLGVAVPRDGDVLLGVAEIGVGMAVIGVGTTVLRRVGSSAWVRARLLDLARDPGDRPGPDNKVRAAGPPVA